MPAYYDPDRKTYYCKFRYTDYTGESRQKMKRGFKLKRDAVEWESEFLHKAARSQTFPCVTAYRVRLLACADC